MGVHEKAWERLERRIEALRRGIRPGEYIARIAMLAMLDSVENAMDVSLAEAKQELERLYQED